MDELKKIGRLLVLMVRSLIMDYIEEGLLCLHCGDLVSHELIHIDHVYPLTYIISDYIEFRPDMSFEDYHLDNAVYLILCNTCNLKKGTMITDIYHKRGVKKISLTYELDFSKYFML